MHVKFLLCNIYTNSSEFEIMCKPFLEGKLCALQGLLCVVVSRPVCAHTHAQAAQHRGNIDLRVELDRYIGNTHHRGRLWDNRNHRKHRQMMTIGDQSVPMFHDDVTHWIHLTMDSIGHPCRTIQGSARYLPLMIVGPTRADGGIFLWYDARPTLWSSCSSTLLDQQSLS